MRNTSDYGDDQDWISPVKPVIDIDPLEGKLQELKTKWREGQLDELSRYRREKIDPEHHGDKAKWSAPFSPLKRKSQGSKPVGLIRSSLDVDIDTFYSSLFANDGNTGLFGDKQTKLTNPSSSPMRGRIRPKSASFQNTYNRHKVLERSFSGHQIKEKFKRDETERSKIANVVFEREKWMKERLVLCVDEANVYSRTIGEPFLYKVHMTLEDVHTYDQSLQKHLASTRYDQLYIEVINLLDTSSHADRGKMKTKESTRIMSADRFYEDHTRLYSEIKKRRSLMAKADATAERLRDKRSEIDYGNTSRSNYMAFIHAEKKDIKTDSIIDGTTFVKEKANKKLRSILMRIINNTVELENQHKEIRSRGWNVGLDL